MPLRVEEQLTAARELLTANHIPWAVAGGWALDVFVGRETRDHTDLDLAVWRVDQHRLQSAAAPDWELQLADDGALRPWRAGEWLSLPIHEIHVRHVRHAVTSLELLLNERDDTAWIYRRDPEVRRPLTRAILVRDATPFLAPEIVLLYKSKAPRLTDESDFRVALPALTTEQREWLRPAIARSDGNHPWLEALETP